MKINSSVKLICKYCKLIKRGKRLNVICYNKKHKQKQG